MRICPATIDVQLVCESAPPAKRHRITRHEHRRAGKTTCQRYGIAQMSAWGERGGIAVLQRYGVKRFSELGVRGSSALREKYSHEVFVAMGLASKEIVARRPQRLDLYFSRLDVEVGTDLAEKGTEG